MALSRGLITNTPREAAARGCRARLSHLISISLAWSLLSLARSRPRTALAVHTTCAASSRVPALPQAPFKLHNAQRILRCLPAQWQAGAPAPACTLPVGSARTRAARERGLSHSHPPACPRWARLSTTGRCWCPYPASRRWARKLLPPASSCLILVMLFASNPLHAAAAFAAFDALVVVKDPATSRSPRRRAVGWPPSRDSGQPHAAASRGTDELSGTII